jgi:DNA-binding PucR family transcriptional regulator
MATHDHWDRPQDSVARLIRATALRLLEGPAGLFEEVDAAVLATAPEGVVADPALNAAVGATNRANLAHWATANLEDPGARVPPLLGPETMDLARDVVRRGLDDTSFDGYRVGQNIAWRYWMAAAFDLAEDPDDLREMLDVTSRSIAAFVDDTLAAMHERIDRERAQLTRGTHAERLEVVNLILEGAPITAERAGARLRYELARRHTAAILWSDAGAPGQGRLERAADAVARAAGARRPFTVGASASSLWAWFTADGEPDTDAVRAALEGSPGVRVALGSTAAGIEGFRRSHLDALAGQRLMHRMPGELRVAGFEDVQLVALAAQDEERASEFVTRTLGDLATAEPALRDTLRVYIREEFSASRAARALFTHRNTVLNRLGRATELLPAPLAGRGLEVGLALEIVHWLGPRPAGGAGDQRLRLTVSAGLTDRARARASGTTTR